MYINISLYTCLSKHHHRLDTAWYNAKQVWNELSTFGFKHNLLRAAEETTEAINEGDIHTQNQPITSFIPQDCRICLSHIGLYEIGTEFSYIFCTYVLPAYGEGVL
jgi:hypothetical protein